MPTCRVTKGNLLVEPCTMPVDCEALHSSERVDLDVMADNTLCEEATVEIKCLEDGIPDFDLLDVIDQKSKLAQSCELNTLQTEIVLSVALHAVATAASLHAPRQTVVAVSYTHLTLPTNREV